MAFAPDGRLFVCEQGGRLRVIKNGVLLSTPFLTVSTDSSGERGLLGIAFDPDFANNQFIYVYYTATTPAVHNRVSRFTANGDVAVPGSETILLDLNNLTAANNHNGGAMHFGLDGKLYIAVGENANSSNSQTLTNLLGKILRINANGTIPTDNPFFNTATGVNRAIWALGLRNPFTFSVQPGTGRIFINDVGESSWEEINEGVAGANYGWPTTEGATTDPRFRSPLFAYGHGSSGTTGCAITGGVFYNPPSGQFPAEYVGDYFFADFCSGWIRRYDPATGAVTGFATGIDSPVDLQVDVNGHLYYLAAGAGAVFQVRHTANQSPTIGTHPTSQTVPAGGSTTFTVSASGTAPLGYQWQRNGANIAGATSTSYTLSPVTTADNGATFRCVVTNAFGTATSNAATLTVTSNTAPTGTITAPGAGARYRGGDVINYAGTGSDAEDGTLPASAFTWTVVFHHDTHTHPFLPATSGSRNGSFTIPTVGHTETNVWYRVQLTVRDSSGATHSSFVDVLPQTVTLQLATSPAGLQVTLDGQPRSTPVSVPGVVGITRTLGVISPQTLNGTTYEFQSWSDGGAATHDIATPATSTTYTATYRVRPPSTGLVAAYAFDENAGPTATDASGSGNTGLIAGATWTTQGRFGSALVFDGANDWVAINDAASLDLAAGLTLEAWVFPTVSSGWRTVILKEQPGQQVYALYSSTNNNTPAGQVYVNAAGQRVHGPSALPVNTWTHLATTYNGSVQRLYVNGVEVASRPQTGPVRVSDGPLRIGGNNVWGEFFQGRIDEVRIYSRVLTASEIQADMNSGVGSGALAMTSLAAPGEGSAATATARSTAASSRSTATSPAETDSGSARGSATTSRTSIAGTVVAADQTTPVPGSFVELFAARTGGRLASTFTGANGTYRFADVAGGGEGFTVRAHSPTAFSLTAERRVPAGARAVDLTLPLSVVRGTARFASGDPIPFPTVFLEALDGRVFFAAGTDEVGRYVIFGAPTEAFNVSVQDTGSGLTRTVGGRLTRRDVTATVNVELPASGTLTGRVVRSDGSRVPLAIVALETADPAFVRFTQTDANGLYEFRDVAVGPVSVQASVVVEGRQLFGSAAGHVGGGVGPLALDVTVTE
jgi:glucose/arabinose dehydrogenase